MVGFVPCAQSFENLQRFLARRLADIYRLKTAFKRGVLLNMRPVFRDSRGSDDLKFSARQSRLYDVCGIDRALSRPRADYRVYLVDEYYDIGVFFDLSEDFFQSLLKLSSVFRAGYHAC